METNYGHLTFELYNETPIHRDNFLRLIHDGYYNGVRFHRIIRGFVVQAGDEKTKSNMASSNYRKEYTIASEIVKGMYHTRGSLAMARQPDQVNPDKKSSGTQFYIVHGAPVMASTLEDYEIEKDMEYPEDIKKMYKNPGGSPQLDKEYTIFGHLIDGYDVLDKIAQVSTDSQDKPKEAVEIIRVTEIR
jgi:peptidyl-prolyl cis-trans isomerase B (cyclophilin B)